MSISISLQELCPDCAVSIGEDHKPNCDVERCPACGFQRLSCDCTEDETRGLKNIPWSGEFPGKAECREYGLYARRIPGTIGWTPCDKGDEGATEDLNSLYTGRVWNKQRQKWIPAVCVYAWASGLLEIGPTCPADALPLLVEEETKAKELVDVLATHSYTGNQRLVPKSQEWISALIEGDEEKAMEEAFNSVMDFRARLIRAAQGKREKRHGEE